jgi:hypothetical protein
MTDDDASAFAIILPIKKRVSDDYEVWPENWDAIQMFLRCQTQWRTAGMGGVIGLDYAAVSWVLRLYKIKDQRAVLEDLQVMEAAVIEGLAEKGG